VSRSAREPRRRGNITYAVQRGGIRRRTVGPDGRLALRFSSANGEPLRIHPFPRLGTLARAELGVPEDLEAIVIDNPRWLADPDENRPDRYRMTIEAVVCRDSKSPDGPCIQVGAGAWLQLWRVRVRFETASLYVDSCWHPEHGQTVRAHNCNPLQERDWELAKRGEQLLRSAVHVAGRTPLFEAQETFMGEVKRAMDAAYPNYPNLPAAKVAGKVPLSRSQLFKRLGDYGVTYEQVREQYLSMKLRPRVWRSA
jgi:hypothetical protein